MKFSHVLLFAATAFGAPNVKRQGPTVVGTIVTAVDTVASAVEGSAAAIGTSLSSLSGHPLIARDLRERCRTNH
jgi:hypothetical protein